VERLTRAAQRNPPPGRAIAARLLAILALLVALAAFTWFDNAVNRGITYAPAPGPIAWADVPQLGVNAYNIQFEPDPANVTRTLEMARTMGAHYVRMQMPWDDVEIHAKGDFEDRRNPQLVRSAWEKYDFIFGEMRRLDLEPIVRIDRSPAWARKQSDASERFQAGLRENANSTGPPDIFQDYADFVGRVAARYRGAVRFIQIWNEPNLAYEWNWVIPEPERFTELLRVAASAARSANPDVVILFPSLSPTDGLEPRIAPMSELEYLDRVYRAGGAAAFDIMSAQAYGLGQPPDEHRYVRPRALVRRPLDTRIDVSRVVLLREVMERNGDGRKAVWISEFGYVSAPAELPHSWGESISEEQKARYLVGQLERARREWPWVGVMNVWFLRWGGAVPDARDPTAYFAIVGHDFTARPAYQALQTYAQRGAVAGPGAHSWEHPAIRLLPGRMYQLRITGQSLALLLASPARVSVDGGAATAFNPDVEGGAVTVAARLADGEHIVTIETALTPRGFLVGREQPLPWLWPLAPLALVALLALVCGSLLQVTFHTLQRGQSYR
jgi:hypothetical protein